MRVVMLGMIGPLAAAALTALLEAGAEVAAVAVPAPPGAPPVARLPQGLGRWPSGAGAPGGVITVGPSPLGAITVGPPRLPLQIPVGPPRPPSLLQLAAERGLPVLALRRMGAPAVRDALAALRPELLVVACWPWRLPPALLAVPSLGALNLHPSPLPELRGPEPLFWAFHEGRAATAVTLHWMDEGLDTGPVALQRELPLPAGAGWDETQARAAELGAGLLREAVALVRGGALPRRPQGAGGSYRPSPGPADFAIDPTWSAERAYRFMRGTESWGVPYAVELGGAALQLERATGYDSEGRLGASYVLERGSARIQMTPGVLGALVSGLHPSSFIPHP